MRFIETDNVELFLSSSHWESPYKRISTFLLSDNDSKSTTKVFTLFVRSVRRERYGGSAIGRHFLFPGYTCIKGFKHPWKLCRKRCSFRWLKPRRKRVSNFSPFGSKMLKILFYNGWIKGNSFCLNRLIASEFLKFGSRWHYSSSEAGKKEDLTILTGKNCVLFNSVQNGWLAASASPPMFAQSIKFYDTFYYHVLRVQMFEKCNSSNRQ